MFHTAWTARDGIPTAIYDIAQTNDGYLWLASESGLFRFDGIHFERFTPAEGPSLPANSVYSLTAFRDGSLWIGWRFEGISRLKDGVLTNFGRESGLPAATANGVAEDGSGRIWAATASGLYRFQVDHWLPVGPEMGFFGKPHFALFGDRDGALWVADPRSVYVISGNEQRFHLAFEHPAIDSMTQDYHGTVWGLDDTNTLISLSTASGPRRILMLPLPRKASTAIFDRRGNLWLGTTDGGLARLRALGEGISANSPKDVEWLSSREGGLSSNQVHLLTQDREGNMWAATNRGLDRLRLSAMNLLDLPDSYARMALLASSDGGVYVAPREFPLIRVPHPLQMTENSPLPTSVTCAYRAPDGTEWFGGQSGLWRKDGDRFTAAERPFPDRDVQAMTSDAGGGLWVTIARKGGGLFRFKDGIWTPYGNNSALPRGNPLTEMTDAEGNVWFGYQSSEIALLDPRGRVQIFSALQTHAIGNVTAMYAHGKNIWFGGENGLRRFADGRFEQIEPGEDHRFVGVSGIVGTENGDLWLNEALDVVRISATELERFHLDPSHKVSIRVFDVLDGLIGGAVQLRPLPSAVEGRDGKLWFALTNSVMWIDPKNIPVNRIVPSVLIESISADGRLYPNLRALRLQPDPASLRIDYTAPSLSIPERVLFRYKLDGVDRDWQNAGTRRQAFYTQLRPGNYRFHVIASNEDGVLNERGATLAFVIPPTMIETAWFKLLCLLAAFSALALTALWRLNEMTRKVKSQLSERMVERERIARELHDTLLQGFHGLVLRFQTATRRIPENEPARGMMEIALDRADEILIEGRNRVLDLRAESSHLGDLSEALRVVGDELALMHPAAFVLSVKGSLRGLHPIVRDEAYSIGREALCNAFVHGEAKAVECEITFHRRRFVLGVRDDGKGIDAEVLTAGRAGHWGLSGMRERSTKLMGSLEIWSRSGAGTEVELKVPSRIAYATKRRIDRWSIFRPWISDRGDHDAA